MTTRNVENLPSSITDTFDQERPLFNEEIAHDVLEEMARAHAKDHQGLGRVLIGIEEGRIDGDTYNYPYHQPTCGCFYGNFSAFDPDESIRIAWQMRSELGAEDTTVIEQLVEKIPEGTTDQTDNDDGTILHFIKVCILYTLGITV
jgi:hypothetical protein